MHRDEKLIGQRLEHLIRWKPGAGSHLRNCYFKDSRTTIYRRNLDKKRNQDLMARSKTIDMYCTKSQSQVTSDDCDKILAKQESSASISISISKLESLNLESSNVRADRTLKAYSQFDRLRSLAVLRFLRTITENHKSRISSSQHIAEILFGKNGFSYRARTIRDWSD